MNTTKPSPLASVVAFRKAMGLPVARGWVADASTFLDLTLIAEEYGEMVGAYTLWYDTPDSPRFREELTKELADLLYVTYGLAACIGIDIEAAFARIHGANMSKLDPETGKPCKRADGKVLKGPAYCPPDLADLARDVPVTL